MKPVAWLRAPALPAVPALPRGLDLVLGVALAAYGFLLPFSVAGTNLLLLVLAVLAAIAFRSTWATRPWREPAALFGLLLLAWIALHTLALDGWSADTRATLARYKELLFLPLLYALFRASGRPQWFFRALVAAGIGYAALHWIGLFVPRLGNALAPRYISAGFEFALLAFLLLEQARQARQPWPWGVGAAFFALTVLVALQGRTGQLVLLCLLAWSAWTQAPRRWRLALLVAVPLLAVAIALLSPRTQARIAETRAALQDDTGPATTSSEIRLRLVRYGVTLAGEHYLLGAGYNQYARIHEQAVRRDVGASPQGPAVLAGSWVRTDNPHAEYLMQLVGGGLVALALFAAWLAAPLWRRDANGQASTAIAGLVLAFAVGCLFNSLLMDFVEGHFYTALLAWLLARQARPAVAA